MGSNIRAQSGCIRTTQSSLQSLFATGYAFHAKPFRFCWIGKLLSRIRCQRTRLSFKQVEVGHVHCAAVSGLPQGTHSESNEVPALSHFQLCTIAEHGDRHWRPARGPQQARGPPHGHATT